MITILTTIDSKEKVEKYIASVPKLDELVTIKNINDERSDYNQKFIHVIEDLIISELDWFDKEPPYLFPQSELNKENFLALTFYKLGNHQRALQLFENSNDDFNHLLAASSIQVGEPIDEELLQFIKETSAHNYAIALHYGRHNEQISLQDLFSIYEQAIEESQNDEVKLYTAKNYLNLLLDQGQYDQAIAIARKLAGDSISAAAKHAMMEQLSIALTASLEMPFSSDKLTEIEKLQVACITFYEERELKVKAGLLLIDASEVANYRKEYALSKEYISKAINYFREEELPEFLGEATFRKAMLLYTWSKDGSPQYYKPAINAFQDSLKVFKRDTHPEKFAEVQHNLAIIYSEMPVGPGEQGIWSAFCASAFKEALAVYDKQRYPYQFATVAHNYATALINFPEAKIHNNLKKADNLFKEALEIRTGRYPLERALTLLNQLELYWLINNENTEEEQAKHGEMQQMAREVLQLTTDEKLTERANDMLARLEELKPLIK